jgi:hypothetical protein
MDSFFASFTTREEGRPIIAYGAASFLPTGKGEVSVPVQRVLKTCRKHYQTMLVNEYLTTKVMTIHLDNSINADSILLYFNSDKTYFLTYLAILSSITL